MQSSNPALNRSDWGRGQRLATFRDISPEELQQSYESPAFTPVHERTMTVDDVVMRTLGMLGLLFGTAAVTWLLGPLGMLLALPAALIGFVLALVIIFKFQTNAALILTYAGVEGVLIGGISRFYAETFQDKGMILQAVIGTAGVFGGMAFAYRAKWIRATPKFTRWLTGALIGVVVLMFANLLMSWIGGGNGLGLRDGGTIAIIFSLVCIGVAALTFILDFDGIEKAIAGGAPQRYAWYGAFGIVMGLIWLYLEILRLLSYFRD